jgi:hypothetical protein
MWWNFFGDCCDLWWTKLCFKASNFLSNNKPFVIRPLFHHLSPKFHSHEAKHSFRDQLNGPPHREQGTQNMHAHCVRMGMLNSNLHRPVTIIYTYSRSNICVRHWLQKKPYFLLQNHQSSDRTFQYKLHTYVTTSVRPNNTTIKQTQGLAVTCISWNAHPVPTDASQENLHNIISLAS